MTNSPELGISTQNFAPAAVTPEVAAARDALSTAGNNLVDWCVAHPGELTPAVQVLQPRDGMTQVHIDVIGSHPEDEGSFIIVHRDDLALMMGQMTASAEESPFSVTRGFPGEEPDSWRKISTVFPSSGRPRIETSYEQEVAVRPGMTTYKPLDAYTGRPATADDITSEHGILATAAQAAGLPPEAIDPVRS